MKGQEPNGGHLGDKGLGGGHSDFGTRPGEKGRLGLTRNGGAGHIGHRQGQIALPTGMVQGAQGIRGLSRLGHPHNPGSLPDPKGTIAELGGDLHTDRDVREGLDQLAAKKRGVVGGPAGHEDDLRGRGAQTGEFGEHDPSMARGNPPLKGIHDGPGPLEDLLFHEMPVVSLLRGDGIPGNLFEDRRERDGSVDGKKRETFRSDRGNDVGGKRHDLPGPLQECRNIGGEEKGVVPLPQKERSSPPDTDKLSRSILAKNGQGIAPPDITKGQTHRLREVAGGAKVPVDQMGHHLGIRLGRKGKALRGEAFPELPVVLDDSVVNDDNGTGAVRVSIVFGGGPVGRPADVANGGSGSPLLPLTERNKIGKLSGGTGHLYPAILSEIGDSGRVISPIFEARQGLEDKGDGFLRSNIADDSTHQVDSFLLEFFF